MRWHATTGVRRFSVKNATGAPPGVWRACFCFAAVGEADYIDELLVVVVVVVDIAPPEVSADIAVPVSAGAATSVEVSVVVVVSAGFEQAAAVRARAAAASGRSFEVMLVFTWRSLLTNT